MTFEATNQAPAEIINDNFDEFGQLVSETTTATLIDLSNAAATVRLVRTNVDLGDVYLNAFDPAVRQQYNCRTCLKFLNGIATFAFLTDDDEIVPVAFHQDLIDEVPELFKASFKALCDQFTLENVSQFQVVTTDMIDELGEFVGKPEAGGFHHFAVNPDELGYAAVKSILIAHAVDLSKRDNGVGRAEAKAIHEYLQEAIKHDFSKLIASGKLRERDKPLYNYMINLFEEYRDGNRTLVVLKQLIDKGIYILNLRNSVVGAMIGDVMNGLSFETALERYLGFIDPRYYKRPTRLPTEKQFEESVNFLTEKGYDKYLPVRFASFDECLGEFTWARTVEEVGEEGRSNDVFAQARKRLEPAKPKPALVDVPVEGISLLGFESILKDHIEAGELKGLQLRANRGFVGALTMTQDPEAGCIYKTGKSFAKFYGSDPVPLTIKHAFFEIDNFEMDAIILERDDFRNPMISLVKNNALWKTRLPMTVFPDDLIDELQPHRRAIEHWATSTSMNVDEQDKVIEYDNVPIVIALSVGHVIIVTTETERYTYEITSLR